ncbi:MAG: hypothetical protein V4807_12360 [Burkholderia gladioli]|uniref:hypothetical protein n=1 Tax=Burkholderia gladioli TaxID=28095 RepID=UPI002856D030|nr:hypothetical protein [Burkholderia gladioli]MDR8091069.1 hypothetical protein [Burkholderia gladioli]
MTTPLQKLIAYQHRLDAEKLDAIINDIHAGHSLRQTCARHDIEPDALIKRISGYIARATQEDEMDDAFCRLFRIMIRNVHRRMLCLE